VNVSWKIVAGCALTFALSGGALLQSNSPRQVLFPQPDIGASTLAARAQAQRETLNQFKVFTGFHFTDKLAESGITFRHQAVVDALQNYKAVHYDHGSAVAVADVDGDGRYDLLFLNYVGGNSLWKNLGGGKFKDITADSGIALPGLVSVSAAFADIDNDGNQDLVITTVRGGVHLFHNDGQGHFTDITKQSGISVVGHSTGAMFFDYDRDGLLDLLVCNVGKYTTNEKNSDGSYVGLPDAFSGQMYPERYEHPVLYHNLGHNKFKDVTAEMGLTPHMWCGDLTFTDLNGDGWPDVYMLNMQGDDHYFENQGGKRFVDKTAQYFPKTPWGSMGVKFFDYANEGRQDLLLTDMHSDMSQEVGPEKEKLKSEMKFPDYFLMTQGTSIYGNALYHNLGGGKFAEVSDPMGVETYWPWGVSVADINADGFDDVFVTAGMGYPFRYGINSMLLNNRGQKFLDAEFLLGIEPRKGGRTNSFSFDLDCSVPQQGRSAQVCQSAGPGAGKISVMGTLSSRSSVIFDLDDDGDLDIVTNDFNSEPMVLISDLSERKAIHWIKILLEGTKSNRNGLGATVRVYAGGQTYTKYNDGKSGYLAQSVLPLYFGLDEATKIDRIEVDWPSGAKQIVNQDLAINTTRKIVEPH
jgi:enediyne biosynthesis protein E4